MLVEHHTKYKEIHGIDETTWMTRSEHQKLHQRLRREGMCKIPSHELLKIANAAHDRTKKNKAYHRTFIRDYQRTVERRIDFTENIGLNAEFHEQIIYNHNTGCIGYRARFRGNNGYALPIINEVKE